MSYDIQLLPHFKKEAKKLTNKYPSLKNELAELFAQLKETPTLGTPIGNNVYKIRLAIASINKGKSGGARVMSLVKVEVSTVLLFSIYSKGDQNNISAKEIDNILKDNK